MLREELLKEYYGKKYDSTLNQAWDKLNPVIRKGQDYDWKSILGRTLKDTVIIPLLEDKDYDYIIKTCTDRVLSINGDEECIKTMIIGLSSQYATVKQLMNIINKLFNENTKLEYLNRYEK